MDLLVLLLIPAALYAVTVIPCVVLFVLLRRRWRPSSWRPLGLATVASLCFAPVLLEGHIPGLTPLAIALVLRVARGQRFDTELAVYAAGIVFALAWLIARRGQARAGRVSDA